MSVVAARRKGTSLHRPGRIIDGRGRAGEPEAQHARTSRRDEMNGAKNGDLLPSIRRHGANSIGS